MLCYATLYYTLLYITILKQKLVFYTKHYYLFYYNKEKNQGFGCCIFGASEFSKEPFRGTRNSFYGHGVTIFHDFATPSLQNAAFDLQTGRPDVPVPGNGKDTLS